MVNIPHGQGKGFTNFPCSLCMWNSRARKTHCTQKEWPNRETLKADKSKIESDLVAIRENKRYSPFPLKLGSTKQHFKSLNAEGEYFQYVLLPFEKIKPGAFIRRIPNLFPFA
ncbi:hypothetical protein AVEN_91641-1 [Araneus ventricosus]|uniref:Uncharacterized protein n=1 Tax=Araneus ventricosus TaxID=182803 RepID=A0A4Y2EVJ6_ARAVE|nr:hypothetical protein AVEN_91641-1 [Araneus ventricosus]